MTKEIPISEQENSLVSRVVQTFRENVTHRSTSGVDAMLAAADLAWAKMPTPEDLALFKSMGVIPSTYDSLTRVKIVQVMAVLTKVFGQIGDKSWGTSASPNPVLPNDVEAGIILKYAKEGLELAKAQKVADEETLAEYALNSIKANEKQIQIERVAAATERAKRMELIVDDQLLEAGFTVNIIKNFIANLSKLGTGLIIGPCDEPVVALKLTGGEDTVKYEPKIVNAVRFSVPDTMDVYPSPGAINVDDADLCIRVRYAKADLARAAESKAKSAWRPAVIRSILTQWPNGVDNSSQTLTDSIEKAARNGELPGTTKKYEGVRSFMLATGAELRAFGINHDGIGDIVPDSYYDSEVVVLAGRVIFAKVCEPAIGRPVVKTTFYGDYVSFFGIPMSSQIDNCQKLQNLVMAALKKQLQLSGLPPMVIEGYSDFVDADRPGAFGLVSGKVFLKNVNAFSQNSGQQGRSIYPVEIPKIIRELIALFEVIAKLTDDASGFNRNMLGSGNFAGAARTATGLMQIQEAASIIATFVIGNIDATAITPLLNKVVANINCNHPDKRAKGDTQIIARGQLSKVIKSAEQQVVAAGFQATQSGAVAMLLGPEQQLAALREYFKSIEFPNWSEIIPDKERVEWLKTMADATAAADLMVKAQQGEQGAGQHPGAQSGGQPQQAQPQQAAKQAGLSRPSGVEARRGAA